MPAWFKKLAMGFIAVAIVVIVGKAIINDPHGSALKVQNIGHVFGQVFTFFASL